MARLKTNTLYDQLLNDLKEAVPKYKEEKKYMELKKKLKPLSMELACKFLRRLIAKKAKSKLAKRSKLELK